MKLESIEYINSLRLPFLLVGSAETVELQPIRNEDEK